MCFQNFQNSPCLQALLGRRESSYTWLIKCLREKNITLRKRNNWNHCTDHFLDVKKFFCAILCVSVHGASYLHLTDSCKKYNFKVIFLTFYTILFLITIFSFDSFHNIFLHQFFVLIISSKSPARAWTELNDIIPATYWILTEIGPLLNKPLSSP